MGETYYYAGPTTPGNPGFTIDLGQAVVRLGGLTGLTQQAELGQVPVASIDFDDPAGTLNIVGLKQFFVTESACPAGASLTGSVSIASGSTSLAGSGTAFTSELYVGAGVQLAPGVAVQVESILSNTSAVVTAGPALSYSSYSATLAALQRIYNGYIGDRTYSRAPGTSLITGAARRIGMTIVDTNTRLSFRLIQPDDGTSPHAKRPAETDIERIDWLLTIDYLTDTLYDEGFIDRSNPVNLDAADYTGQRAASVLNDCSQQSGKDHFVRYREATGHDVLHYRKDSNAAMDNSPLRLTNVLADVAADPAGYTFLYEKDAILTRDPSRVTAGVMVAYSGGQYYATSTATIDAYGLRDQMAPNQNVKTLAKATALASRYLAENDREDDRITLTVRLPAGHVNDALNGQLIQIKGSHWANEGYGGFSPARVKLKTIKTDQETDERYAVYFELSPQIVPCSGATLAGYYPPLSVTGSPVGTINPTPADGVICYGGTPNVGTSPGFNGNTSHFGSYYYATGTSPSGYIDAINNVSNNIDIFVTGDGTLEFLFPLAWHTTTPCPTSEVPYDVIQVAPQLPPNQANWDFANEVALGTAVTLGTSTWTIRSLDPTNPDQCHHLIRFIPVEGSANTIGFAGVNWTPA